MDLRQLLSVVTVGETGSITAAAAQLHIVQPAITRHIRNLEDELGVELFTRTRQGMVPTPAGSVLIERARRALHEVDRARQELKRDPREVSGVVRVGILESLVGILPSALTEAVAAAYPNVDLRIYSAYSGHLQQWLDAGDLDVSLQYNLTSTPALPVIPLAEDTLWLVAPPDAGLSPDTPVSWSTAWSQDLVLPVAGHGLRVLIDRACDALGVRPTARVETNSMPVQKQLVKDGVAWTILPAAGVAGDIADGTLSGAPLIEPEITRVVVVGVPRRVQGVRAVEAVTEQLVTVARRLVRTGAWPASGVAAPPDADAGDAS